MGTYKSVYKFNKDLYIDTVQALITILATSAAKQDTLSGFSGIANLAEIYYDRTDNTDATVDIKVKDSSTWTILAELPYTRIKMKSNTKFLKHFKPNELIIDEDLGTSIENMDIKLVSELYNTKDYYPSVAFSEVRYAIVNENGGKPITDITHNVELESYPGIYIERKVERNILIDKVRKSGNIYIEKVAMTYFKITTKLYYNGTDEDIISIETLLFDDNYNNLSLTNKKILGIGK